MQFWHWNQIHTKRGNVGWKKRHGKRLVPRWDGTDYPPLEDVPPYEGKIQVETTHPYAIKSNPVIFSGPRCNHDVSVLLRLPLPLTRGTDDNHAKGDCNSGSADRVEDALRSMATAINNANFY